MNKKLNNETLKIFNKIANEASLLMVKTTCIELHENKEKNLEDIAKLIKNINNNYKLLKERL